METAAQRRRVFVSGQLLEYWEHPDVAFGWTLEDLQTYADRGGLGAPVQRHPPDRPPPGDRVRVVSGR
jgi:hypothetical protein